EDDAARAPLEVRRRDGAEERFTREEVHGPPACTRGATKATSERCAWLRSRSDGGAQEEGPGRHRHEEVYAASTFFLRGRIFAWSTRLRRRMDAGVTSMSSSISMKSMHCS